MPKAVRFNEYGDVDVLRVVDVDAPTPGDGEVVVAVKAAGINPGEAAIRKGALHERWPATFPSGQGSDLAGVITATGAGVDGFQTGDEVFGWTDERASHAELVVAPATQLARKPAGVSWEIAGSLHVIGATAWAAIDAVDLHDGDALAVSGAAGGVGHLVVQLAVRKGATVVALASENHHDWLRAHGAIPVTYGDGVGRRITEALGGKPLDAFIDTFGGGYVDLAVELGVKPERIDTIIDYPAAQRVGAKMDGNLVGAHPENLAAIADLIATGDVEIPIAASYPLSDVRDAYRELEQRHTLGKIVLVP
jgi:NADPH:quinone reductase-like Zn-dependent oxidoreductase